jgi:hypothetical protein
MVLYLVNGDIHFIRLIQILIGLIEKMIDIDRYWIWLNYFKKAPIFHHFDVDAGTGLIDTDCEDGYRCPDFLVCQ